jgi:hypothetical protein
MFMKTLGAALRPALACALLALAISAAPASAAAPSAVDDSVGAAPNGTLDVLRNDSDPDGDALTVVSNTQPAHGSASCSSLGACLYSASGGYTGPDSFQYTMSAGGEQATATVSVNVGAGSSSGAPQARDDDAAARFGHSVDFNVLANDSGTGISLASNGNPSHGTVSCGANGDCHYTPNDGYSGSDGFVYTLTDSSQRQASAAAHILVAPADAGYGIGVNGNPDPVPAGGQASWGAIVSSMPGGITGDELLALPLPSETLSLGGPHAVSDGSLQLAPGWSSDTSGGALAVKATRNALLGEGETRTFPKPLPPISQGTGGDGHVPILVGSKVFAFFHHSHPTSVTCVDRATGAACPGYPKLLDGFGTTDINGPAVVHGSRIYTHLQIEGGFAQSASLGLFCWDADRDTTCGLTIVDRVARTSNPGASAPQLAGGKMWFGGDTGKLYCVDPADGSLCSLPIDTGQSTAPQDYWDAVAHGNRFFLARSGGPVSCVDVSAGSTCPGWSTPKSFGGGWNVVNYHDASGAAIGVCVFNVGTGSCVPDADASTAVPVTNWVTRESYSQGYALTEEAETGKRTLVGSLDGQGLGCYDWTTMAPCTGGDYGQNGAPAGWINRQSDGSGLPSRGAYGAAFDGSCVIALGDQGQVYTVDPAGASPCTSLASGASPMSVDLRDQRCDGSVGGAAWRSVKLSDTDASEMDSLVVTVRDGRSGEVLKSGDLIAGDGTLDLSGIDANDHPVLTVDANAKSKAGNKAWDDGIPPRITLRWHADPQQACVRTTGNAECGTGSTPISLLGHLATPSEADASAQLNLLRSACATPIARNEVLSATARKCSGARVFRIRIRYKGSKVRKVTVTANGVKQKVLSLKGRPIARIDLRKRPRQTTVVKITITTKSGKKLTGKRVYHPCTKKLPDRGFKY